MDTIKVILVDDHFTLRDFFRQVLEKAGGIEIIGEFFEGMEAVAAVEEKEPDIIILDYFLPDMNALELVQLLNGSSKETRCIILTGNLNSDVIQASLDQGVLGYIAKEDMMDWLVPSIQVVMKGERILSPTVQKYLALPVDASDPALREA